MRADGDEDGVAGRTGVPLGVTTAVDEPGLWVADAKLEAAAGVPVVDSVCVPDMSAALDAACEGVIEALWAGVDT